MSISNKDPMTIQYEIKSQLAKLLATEDLVVEHKKVETASFNVVSRVLTLPMWNNTTEEVVDMLVSHEVGHALYTPSEEWYKEYKINPNVVNVVEDARIEKLMKRRYDGITKTFYKGYTELHNQDFFDVKKKDITQLSLADRINLFFKIGSHYRISFTDYEQTLVDRVGSCETFQDVLEVSKLIYEYCLDEIEKKKQEQETEQDSNFEMNGDGQNNGGGLGLDEDNEYEDLSEGRDQQSDKGDSDEESHEVTQTQTGGTQGMGTDEVNIVETAESLERSIKNLASMEGLENHYLELPDIDINQIIVDNEVIHGLCDAHFKEIRSDMEKLEKYGNFQDDWKLYSLKEALVVMNETDAEFLKFKKNAQKEVNYLVKEFEMKKSAGAYARATTSRTGILDTTKLHTYKYNEDLFKKVSIIPDGKNHGLIFILDWSGSMAREMLDTIKQLYNLIWFCNKVQIPFEVYAFSENYPNHDLEGKMKESYKPKDGLFRIRPGFSLLNMFTSKVRGKELDAQLKNIFLIATAFNNYNANRLVPLGLGLSSTPLNESIASLHKIIPQFRKDNGVEKVNCVILTDGEAYQLNYHQEVQRSWEDEPYLGERSIDNSCFLRNRKTGKTYKTGDNWSTFTPVMLQDLRDSFPDVNFIGIRIMPSRDLSSFLRINCDDYNSPEVEKYRIAWRKTKAVALKGTGYHTYFGLSSTALSNDTEFEVEEGATKAQIKRAFTKSLTAKKMNKKILSQFVDLIA
jgi:hypothetical protein